MGLIIGVVGASGGLGASTLTTALAVRGPAVVDGCSSAVALDLDIRGGLDTTACIEHLPGTRWDDLVEAMASGAGTDSVRLSELPAEAGVAVLSGPVGQPLPRELVTEALEALGAAADVVAVDCGPRPPAHVLARLDLLVVLVGMTTRHLHDAMSLSRACSLSRTQPVLVSRGPRRRRAGSSLARQVGLPFLAHLSDDPTVQRQAHEGLAPGVLRSAVDAVADEALTMAQSRWLATLVHRLGPEHSKQPEEMSWTA
ncbi:MAG: hypothetical protein GX344_12265 [Intrasporangiaceae bacterium]|nr:hypothetical protein [Intrasporangiaceae bacterium]